MPDLAFPAASMTDPLDFEARAAELLPEQIRAYFATGAGSQATSVRQPRPGRPCAFDRGR